MSRPSAGALLAVLVAIVVAGPMLADVVPAAAQGTSSPTYLALDSVSPWVAPDGTWTVRWSIDVEPPLDSVIRYTVHQAVTGPDARRRLDAAVDGGELGPTLQGAAEVPLLIALEDLHWSDHATLDWLGFMARRPEPARMLVLCTYRPVEVIVSGHPLRALKQELRAHGLCEELPLSLLSGAAAAAYLAQRFGRGDADPEARVLHASFGDFARLMPGKRLFEDGAQRVAIEVARRRLVTFGRLDLDDVAAMVGEDLRTVRSARNATCVDDTNAVERAHRSDVTG